MKIRSIEAEFERA